MKLFIIISGLIVLLFGRKLFWFFIAITGFLMGISVGGSVFPGQPQWVTFLIAIAIGVLGALLALFAQRIAFALAGFYAGSYLTFTLSQFWGIHEPSVALSITGGIIGMVLLLLLMNWAIIILSSLAGAGAIAGTLNIGQEGSIIAFGALVAIGIVTQSSFLKMYEKPKSDNGIK
ncbi:MAG: TMEM198/TM7SF3 family protein [Nitrospiraceae bacterium]|nr:MAG: TMEM198/TM7SF3 family protein [Nitrospiraceae bacterium]